MFRTVMKTLCFTQSLEDRLKKNYMPDVIFFILKSDILQNTNKMKILEFYKICMIYRNFKMDAIITKLR